jgi:hypothetical protein
MVADAKERLDKAVENGMLTEAQAKQALSEIEERIDDLVNGNLRFRERHDFRWRSGPPDHGGWRLPPAA